MMKVYEGTRDPEGEVRVTVGVVADVVGVVPTAGVVTDRKELALRLDLRNHSPTGFEWGYGGSGPAQLALALCADALGDDARAQAVYQHYKWQHVLKFPVAGWTMTDEQIKVDVAYLEESAARAE